MRAFFASKCGLDLDLQLVFALDLTANAVQKTFLKNI